jgi:deoxyadenosine/deoxycytidine kinase
MAFSVFIEGSVGCGKSSLIENLRTYYYNTKDVELHPEIIETYRNVAKRNLFADRSMFQLDFQIHCLLEKFWFSTLMGKEKNIICESSPLSSVFVFGEMLSDNGDLKRHQQTILHNVYGALTHTATKDGAKNKNKHYIYIEADPDACMQRSMLRERPEEFSYDLNFFKEMQMRYMRLFKQRRQYIDGDVYVVNGNESASAVLLNVIEILQKLQHSGIINYEGLDGLLRERTIVHGCETP